MSTSLRLEGDLRVPILIQQNNIRSTRKVDTEAACTGRDQHHAVVALKIIEHPDAKVSACSAGGPIDSNGPEARSIPSPKKQKLFDEVKHLGKAGEYH
jgi:hypothetical protein